MLHFLIAALQIVWWGPGVAGRVNAHTPVVIARSFSGRVTVLRAIDGRETVPAEWSVTPQEAMRLDVAAGMLDSGIASALVEPGSYRGPATVRAQFQNQSATLSAFVYGSLNAGCFMSNPNGLRFDENGAAHPAGTPQESDIFISGPQSSVKAPLYGCFGAFVWPRWPIAVHAPYGATIVSYKSGTYVGDVRVNAWRNDFTVAPALHEGDVLLFRTHDGRVVKLLIDAPSRNMLAGAYVVSPYRGEFYDYVAYHHIKPVPHAIFGRRE